MFKDLLTKLATTIMILDTVEDNTEMLKLLPYIWKSSIVRNNDRQVSNNPSGDK